MPVSTPWTSKSDGGVNVNAPYSVTKRLQMESVWCTLFTDIRAIHFHTTLVSTVMVS